MNTVLSYLDSVDSLLCSLPTRERIARSPQLSVRQSFKIRVDRTMPFEFIGNLLPPFCRLWEADVKLDFSDYDTTLSQLGGDLQADVYMIWLDWRIYRTSMTPLEAASWLMERIGHLRGLTSKTIWVNNWPESLDEGDRLFSFRVSDRGWVRKLNGCLSDHMESRAGCELIDLTHLAYERTGLFFDDRNDEISSYPFADQATIRIARHLGTHLLPATFMPRLKAIVVDLDDTLYRGVLGEEGSAGVVLTEGHLALQKLLLRLKNSGILLMLCSRNEEEDVKELFDSRDDFPLKWIDFAAVSANWQLKSDNMNHLASQVNIDPSAILFVDDNAVELLHMASELPAVHLLRAEQSGKETMIKLSHYPGLYQLHHDNAAASRTADIQANQRREQIRSASTDYSSYLESLKMIVRIYENEPNHARRLYDLSHKTNQFNLALRRISELEALEVMDRSNYLTVTVSLSDLLSDSGIIGAFVCRLDGNRARLIEMIFSCRALGRHIETLSFACLLEKLQVRGVEKLTIDVIDGPRNKPALDWLKGFVAGIHDNLPLNDLLSAVQAACMKHQAIVEVIE
jgi:FkbH-like protein